MATRLVHINMGAYKKLYRPCQLLGFDVERKMLLGYSYNALELFFLFLLTFYEISNAKD